MNVRHARQRAERLRGEADTLPAPLAVAYRRRAAELELAAQVTDPFEPMALAA